MAGALCAGVGFALAKLPPANEATKALAAETAARNAWQSKLSAYQLCKAQDRVAARYLKAAGGKRAILADTPTAGSSPGPCADPGSFVYPANKNPS